MECKLKYLFLSVVALLVAMSTACSDDSDDAPYEQYGYVQFKVCKKASSEGATRSLDRLADAHKIKVVMLHENVAISQTLVLGAYNAENAEYGLRSE